jgi:phage regulator Rha-like protein
MREREEKAELLKKQHITRFNELEKTLKKITSEKEMKDVQKL